MFRYAKTPIQFLTPAVFASRRWCSDKQQDTNSDSSTAAAAALDQLDPRRPRRAGDVHGPDSDPFREKWGWDRSSVTGATDDLDIEALEEIMEGTDIKYSHFGTNSRSVKMGKAIQKLKEREQSGNAAPSSSTGNRMKPAPSKTVITPEGEVFFDTPLTYEEFAVKQLGGQQPANQQGSHSGELNLGSDEGDDDDGEISEGMEFTDMLDAEGHLEVPECLLPDAVIPEHSAAKGKEAGTGGKSEPGSVHPGYVPEASESLSYEAVVAAQQAKAEELQSSNSSSHLSNHTERGISTKDPLQWTTEDIVAFIRVMADDNNWVLDEAMMDAFHMAHVNGNTLLNTCSPPDLFKQMRKFHLNRATYKPVVSEILVQETLYLCYPYGRF